MKNKVSILFCMLLFSAFAVNGQNSGKKNSPEGTWKYEAPTAPSGYTNGTIIISKPEGKYAASVSLAGSNYQIPAENVRYENGNFSCSVYIESQNVKVTIKMENNSKMTGKASYSEGEIPLTLTREKENK